MKIAILHPVAESSSPLKDLDPLRVPDYYLAGHDYESFAIRKATAVSQVVQIANARFDVVINFCDGAWAEDRPGVEVVLALERLGMAFTGAGSRFYEPSREAMKMACQSVGVKFPDYFVVHCAEDVDAAVRRLRFPLIVKHPNSYSSIALTRESRVSNPAELRREVTRMVGKFGSALVEEFIEGREFTTLVAEPRNSREDAWVLEPVEFLFPQGETFKHFDLKWKDFGSMETRAVADPVLSQRLREASALVFVALSGTGYGRCDFRVDAAGEVYFLEINPNCGIFYSAENWGSADFILAHEPGRHKAFLEHLIACAIRRRDRMVKPWQFYFDRDLGFGMVASRPVKVGEVVERYEERPQVLVSERHVQGHWKGLRREWFERYAWPISAGVKAMWSDDPLEWRPINHSCDPNTWLTGLDVVARRNIQTGEALTIDYATFCGPSMSPFECHCGTALCRGVILGTDHLLSEIRTRYGDHVSDFVRSSQAEEHQSAPPYAVARNSIGFGVVAKRYWKAGETVSPLVLENTSQEAGRWTIQCSAGRHSEPLPFELRYINHSCEPNVLFDVDAGVLRALKDIAPGDELSAFYPATEWDVREVFDCLCRAQECLGRIAGAAQTPQNALTRQILCSHIQASLRHHGSGPATT